MRPHADAPSRSTEPIRRVRESFADIHDVNAFTPAFHDRRFERAPAVPAGDDLAEQRRTLARMLGTRVAGPHPTTGLQDTLACLGQRHAGTVRTNRTIPRSARP